MIYFYKVSILSFNMTIKSPLMGFSNPPSLVPDTIKISFHNRSLFSMSNFMLFSNRRLKMRITCQSCFHLIL